MNTGALLPADWPAPPGVRVFTTLRHGAGASLPPFDDFNMGNRYAADGDDPAAVERNRRELVQRFGLPSDPHWLKQVHGTRVLRFEHAPCGAAGAVDGGGSQVQCRSQSTLPRSSPSLREREEVKAEPEADASVTSTSGVVLAILSADCLPVVLAADDGSEVAAAHAGWRGLADGVIEFTVQAMHAPPGALLAWLGPAAGPGAYEVGQDVFDAFVSRNRDSSVAFSATRPGHWRVDLYALARMRLHAAGVSRIHGGGLCTISEPQRFYSHRRDARTGRMATLAWIQM